MRQRVPFASRLDRDSDGKAGRERVELHRSEHQRRSRRWVVKIGSALLTDGQGELAPKAIENWTRQIAELHQRGMETILVTSGAVAVGMARLGWREYPTHIYALQAAAAAGQSGLVEAYEHRFKAHGLIGAQILLTQDDLRDRRRYLNARNTLKTLINYGVIPIVNENDTVVTDEIRFGDNDTLAALVANLMAADLLTIVTDSAGVFEADPRIHPDTRLIEEADSDAAKLLAVAGSTGNALGTGGMRTKVLAAKRAARSGTATVIASGLEPDLLLRLSAGESWGTFVRPVQDPLGARKRWLADQLQVQGYLHLDAGAARVIREQGCSLLPVGVVEVEGQFQRGDMVACLDPERSEVCRGLVNYTADEVRCLMGCPSSWIAARLGYVDTEELIHRDDLALSQ